MNDVGQNAAEEINDATEGGKNFGWPSAEGTSSNPAYANPVYAYLHTGAQPTGCAITGGTFFNPQFTGYPASYVGKYFFQDYCSNWIYSLDLSGTPAPVLFGSNVGGSSVALTTGPDGNLYYLSRSGGVLYKVVSNASSAPVITQQPQSVVVSEGTSASFSVSASGTQPFSYQWIRDDVAIDLAQASTYSISPVQLTDAGTYWVRVSNVAGETYSNTAQLTVETVVGVEQAGSDIYPNPAKDWIYLAHRVSAVKIMDRIGREWRVPVERINQQTRLDVQHLANGLYFLMYDLHGTQQVKKILVSR
ncbi:MAG: immunoglobulin domain-containing protein [Cyclobacteriaceae bacterium]|nr:immunoglobulin domain-containing protein [Cyclobacteriaceae bacterium]